MGGWVDETISGQVGRVDVPSWEEEEEEENLVIVWVPTSP